MDARKAVDALLVRWHRWSAAPGESPDTLMRHFDTVVGGLKPCFIAALIVDARNQACGAAVWSNVRVGGLVNVQRARRALMLHLRNDQLRWFGAQLVTFNARGNRIGQSNPNAAVADRDVDLCVQMREQIDPATGKPMYTLGQLAIRFKVAKSTVRWWCNGGRRGQAPARAAKETA